MTVIEILEQVKALSTAERKAVAKGIIDLLDEPVERRTPKTGAEIVAMLEAMEARRMPNGRMAYELRYFGASTGRWSGGGGLNLQNLNRKTAEGVDLRRAIIAPQPSLEACHRRRGAAGEAPLAGQRACCASAFEPERRPRLRLRALGCGCGVGRQPACVG